MILLSSPLNHIIYTMFTALQDHYMYILNTELDKNNVLKSFNIFYYIVNFSITKLIMLGQRIRIWTDPGQQHCFKSIEKLHLWGCRGSMCNTVKFQSKEGDLLMGQKYLKKQSNYSLKGQRHEIFFPFLF